MKETIENFYELNLSELKVVLYLMEGPKLISNVMKNARISKMAYFLAQEKLLEWGFIDRRKVGSTYRIRLTPKFWKLRNVPFNKNDRSDENDIDIFRLSLELF